MIIDRLIGWILLALALGLPAAAAAAPTLRPMVSVSDSVVRLGDLFDGLGDRAKIPVIAAPPAGKRLILGADWLAAIASQQHLGWEPASSFDQVTVERASRVIGADELGQTLLSALAERVPSTGAELRLDTPGIRMVVPADETGAPSIEQLTFDARSGRFSAYVTAPGGDAVGNRLRVSGVLVRHTQVPVPMRPLAAGEVITKRDLGSAEIRTDRISPDMVIQASDLVGKAPRHALRPGTPVRVGDIEVPVVVHRGSLVTIVLETPTMRLTAEGKAMEDGGLHSVIRVANTKSNRTIDAVVAGPNVVAVNPVAGPITQ